MADPVKGSNVLLQVYKSGQFRDYLCATNLTIDFNAEMKSIKTIGDGVWKRQRPQNIGYTVKLDGLIKLNTGDDASSFDILSYMTNFVDLVYRITFEDEAANLKVIYGQGVVSSSEFSGGADGFATNTFTILGNGEPTIEENLSICDLSIDSITSSAYAWGGVTGSTSTSYNITINYSGTGTLSRIEYTIDGGARQTASGTSFQITVTGTTGSFKTYVFYPVCSNGFDGSSNSVNLYVSNQPV